MRKLMLLLILLLCCMPIYALAATEMTITPYPVLFEATERLNYRHYDRLHREVQLPETPYLLLRIRKE